MAIERERVSGRGEGRSTCLCYNPKTARRKAEELRVPVEGGRGGREEEGRNRSRQKKGGRGGEKREKGRETTEEDKRQRGKRMLTED